ncbi:MAG: FAD-dependent oxidoreductase [Alcanivoracaceae bacterium]|nr:FAD-dependent oxidoreductase [Alcanivoracaceae bacterium]
MDDVLVVGGGIIGTLVALECRARGARVSVLDAASPRPSASWAGGGILSPLFPWRYDDAWLPLTGDALPRYRHWQDLIVHAGMDAPEINPCGMLVRAPDDACVESWRARSGIVVCPANQSGLTDRFSSRGNWWMPQVAAVRNPHWLVGLRQLADHQGISWQQATVSSMDADGSVTLQDGSRRFASNVVVTAGYWSRYLLAHLGVAGALKPVKGEMLLYRLAPGEVPAILLSDAGYLIPRRDGLVLAGSTLDPGVTDQRPSEQAQQTLKQMAADWYAPLGEAEPVAHWSGIRPGNTRSLPLIGPVTENRRLWMASGHYRNGLVSAPATAALLAQNLFGETVFCDPAPYSPLSSDSSSDSFCSR